MTAENGESDRVAAAIRRKVEAAFTPLRMTLVDESRLHAGHAGARAGGESHFRLEVVSAAFDGRSRVERQRMVYDLLAEELSGPVHALSVRALTPSEESAGR